MQFNELNFSPPILRALEDAGYTEPTPIQAQAIPPLLEGRDLVGCAQTGTGKTAAFSLPIIEKLCGDTPAQGGRRPVRALILTPTRELALQINENIQKYSKRTGLRCCVVFGGVSQEPQVKQLARGVDILVATPGRLWDLIGQGFVNLMSVEAFVLDEADRMLDMGFIADVRRIAAKLPSKRQNLLFSATMPTEVRGIVDNMLTSPVWVAIDPETPTLEAITQKVYFVGKAQKVSLLLHLLSTETDDSTLVFTRTKHGADRVARMLCKAGVKALAIHGNKSQNARQSALGHFKEGGIRVLVATDIAARGIDIHELKYVVNYDLPNLPETYVHRIGRTGRAGREGQAISFCDIDERPYLRDIEKLICKKIEVAQNTIYPPPPELLFSAYDQAVSNIPEKRPENGHRPRRRHSSYKGQKKS